MNGKCIIVITLKRREGSVGWLPTEFQALS